MAYNQGDKVTPVTDIFAKRLADNNMGILVAGQIFIFEEQVAEDLSVISDEKTRFLVETAGLKRWHLLTT